MVSLGWQKPAHRSRSCPCRTGRWRKVPRPMDCDGGAVVLHHQHPLLALAPPGHANVASTSFTDTELPSRSGRARPRRSRRPQWKRACARRAFTHPPPPRPRAVATPPSRFPTRVARPANGPRCTAPAASSPEPGSRRRPSSQSASTSEAPAPAPPTARPSTPSARCSRALQPLQRTCRSVSARWFASIMQTQGHERNETPIQLKSPLNHAHAPKSRDAATPNTHSASTGRRARTRQAHQDGNKRST
jgi:hypothetical protein